MTAMSGPIRFSKHDMRVDLGAVVFESDIADQRNHFHLLNYRYLFVFFQVTIKIAQHDIPKGTDRREVAATQLLFPCEGSQGLDELVAFVKDKTEPALIERFKFHTVLSFASIQKILATVHTPEIGWLANQLRNTKTAYGSIAVFVIDAALIHSDSSG